MRTNVVIILCVYLFLLCCNKDYYNEIKKDCNPQKASEIFEKLKQSENPAIFKVIEAMADCRSEEIDKYLSQSYSKSNDKIKSAIYKNLVRTRSIYFTDTLIGILINKVQTNEDYKQILSDLNSIDSTILEKKYNEQMKLLNEARQNKNKLSIEIYLENVKALSKILNQRFDGGEFKEEIKSIKNKAEKEELYTKFLDATSNQQMMRSYEIYKKLSERELINKNNSHTKLLSILKELSDTEEKFYNTAQRQDQLMIDLEKAKRDGRTEDMKQLQSELQSVKSDMVFKKRALDRAAKRLELVRELFFEVKK